MSFGERLKAVKKEFKYSQEKFVNLIGYGNTTINGYESETNKPNLDTFIKLCKIFNQPPNYFLQDEVVLKEKLLNPVDKRILDIYKSLTPHDKEIVDHIFNMEDDRRQVVYKFPVYEQQATVRQCINTVKTRK